ncbi:MAG: cobalamin B12-binding domain-containing protein [Actinomycetota bacterium]|nr:cobalamin B12-binding domain-containing protein [Actinomycetota bacterium]
MKRILGASIGSCVHVAGVINFLNLAQQHGYQTKFLGSACGYGQIVEAIEAYQPDIVAISYRLSPDNARSLFKQFKKEVADKYKGRVSFILGGTKPVAEAAKGLDLFEAMFTGEETKDQVVSYLKQGKIIQENIPPPQNLGDRVKFKYPYPVIRHHFGQPTLESTIEGIGRLAQSELIDVVSIGPDQNTQEYFFHPEKMDHSQDGAGGVPLRSEDDFRSLYQATRKGNYPIMRCYSGTNDILRMARVLADTINNAWCAVPLCWYNELDNRSHRKLKEAIAENQQVMAWHGQRNIPVEVNESHHWSLRYSPDSIAVAAAYLAAYNAKRMGVKVYVSQYMFNTPAETSFTMDLAKMMAKVELIEGLHDDSFTSLRQTRTGLYSYPTNYHQGKAQLATSTMLQMQLEPHIVHVVAYCEADHAATPEDIIESAHIAHKAISNCLAGCPNMKDDERVQARKRQLMAEAKLIIGAIRKLDLNNIHEDPLTSPQIIAEAIGRGILDAPHLQGLEAASGQVRTMFIDGANMAVGPDGEILTEEQRLASL